MRQHDEVLDLKDLGLYALGLVLPQRKRKNILVLWFGKYGLDKLVFKVALPCNRVCFPNCEIKLIMKEMN